MWFARCAGSTTPAPVEIIVVVDGSTDGTAEALAAIDCPFPLRVVEQGNCGAASARNRGAAIAVNDIILFLDDDMIADPRLLDEHARLHRDGRRCGDWRYADPSRLSRRFPAGERRAVDRLDQRQVAALAV